MGSTVIGSNLVIGKQLSTSNVTLDISATDAIQLPVGTKEQRPDTEADGQIRYNSSKNTIEGYSNNVWQSLIGLTNDAETTYISADDDNTLKLYTNNNLVAKFDSNGNFKFGTAIETYGGTADFEIHSKGA